ncbi:hypothetical protein [Sinanaerobacter chloroacetimidivorans]|uniref:DUF3156 family protein n=1 Tax=Sinanaerobacter chloroacetimidivorans TaxID=2818044 RepID=A0A8J7W2G1_9FIRM|nr:hypothetical protein [Sinanaerobacter chloroacetimidivorans]MBR0597901.1 hypothetical protein [Sinanaerobacter chloroacetimidivorans]
MDIYLKRDKNYNLPCYRERENPQHIINKKANLKLNYVASIFRCALGGHILEIKDRFLSKNLILEKLRYVKELNLTYKIENRFFAMSYDLIYEATYQAEDKLLETHSCAFAVKLKGAVSVSGAQFMDQGSECTPEDIEGYLNRLNNALILNRIKALDLTDISVSYKASTSTWTVKCRSLIGSTTWNFIPPVLHLITPRKEECIQLIEFYELVLDAVTHKQ